MLNHASLFSGIGGFDMAASWMGWPNVFSSEKDPFCRKILNFYWPETKQYEDIRELCAIEYRGRIDILSGGFPCQPFSSAGRRGGKADDRYLWPEALRIITEARPEWIVLENVAGLFTILEQESLSEMEVQAIELFCSDGEQEANATIIRLQRRIIGTIISEITAAGYVLPQLEDGTPVVLCIPACALNAPHRRDRIWFVAHAAGNRKGPCGDQLGELDGRGQKQGERQTQPAFDHGRAETDSRPKQADTNRNSDGQHFSNSQNEIKPGKGEQYAQYDINQVDQLIANTGRQRQPFPAKIGELERQRSGEPNPRDIWKDWPAQSPVCGGNDGLPRKLDGITFSKWRSASIKAFGNAIVPEIALELFRAIAAVH